MKKVKILEEEFSYIREDDEYFYCEDGTKIEKYLIYLNVGDTIIYCGQTLDVFEVAFFHTDVFIKTVIKGKNAGDYIESYNSKLKLKALENKRKLVIKDILK